MKMSFDKITQKDIFLHKIVHVQRQCQNQAIGKHRSFWMVLKRLLFSRPNLNYVTVGKPTQNSHKATYVYYVTGTI
jgi:hypothetical protein